MTIICWNDSATGQPMWASIPGAAERALEQWQNEHPTEKPKHQFITRDDLLDDDAVYRHAFRMHCQSYGLQETDFGRDLCMPDGTHGILRGYQPGRRKYVFRVWDCGKQKYILCTAALVKNGFQRWADKHQPG